MSSLPQKALLKISFPSFVCLGYERDFGGATPEPFSLCGYLAHAISGVEPPSSPYLGFSVTATPFLHYG